VSERDLNLAVRTKQLWRRQSSRLGTARVANSETRSVNLVRRDWPRACRFEQESTLGQSP